VPRKSPNLEIEEKPGNQFQNLEETRKASLKATSTDLVQIIRLLLESGILIFENGKVVANPEKRSKK
jgi:hypothetical protein